MDREALGDLFNQYDSNKSGSITLDELERERKRERDRRERVKKREGESLSRNLNHSGTHASINYSAQTNSIKNVRTVSSEFE